MVYIIHNRMIWILQEDRKFGEYFEESKKRFKTVNAAMHYIIGRFVEEKKKQ